MTALTRLCFSSVISTLIQSNNFTAYKGLIVHYWFKCKIKIVIYVQLLVEFNKLIVSSATIKHSNIYLHIKTCCVVQTQIWL